MRIGIDARKIRDFGIGNYLKYLLTYLPEWDAANEYVIFHYPADREYIPQTGANIRLMADTSPRYSLRELLALPVKMATLRLDLFHAPHYTLPPLRPCKGIVTIHDVIHLRFPEYLKHGAAYYYAKGMMWAAAASASKVLTVSECSKQDIIRYVGVPADKIAVIYNGIEIPPRPALPLAELQVRFGISRPYILYVGNLLPHKNLTTLIKAYKILKQTHCFPHCLVLAGKSERLRSQLDALIAAQNLGEDVILTDFVEPEWLPALYTHAEVFVYPSFYEGFGLQALEAMVFHVPAAISHAAALVEIAGDAALRFDPASPENMAEVIARILTDPALRTVLIAKGAQRVTLFSWKEMARQTAAIYREVLEGRKVER